MNPRDLASVASHLHLPVNAEIRVEVSIHGCTDSEAWSLAERVKVWLGESADVGADELGGIYRFTCDGGALRIFGDKTESSRGCSTCGREQEPNDPACSACVDADGWIGKVA